MSGGVGEIEDAGGVDFQHSETEKDILSNLEGFEADETDNKTDDEEEDSQEQQEEQRPQQRRQSRNKDEARTRQPGQQRHVERENRAEIAGRIPSRRRVDYDYDQAGNVINPQTKEVLFATGTVEREMFTQLQDKAYQFSRAQRAAQGLADELNRAQATIQEYERVPSVGNDLKLSSQDQVKAFQLMKAFRDDPKKAVRTILTEFQVDGGDLSDIFEGVQTLQLDALREEFGRRFETLAKPQQDAQLAEQQQREAAQNVQREIAAFFESNPDAELHQDMLGHVIRRATDQGQQISLEQAWINLQRFAYSRGLDLSQDLDRQLGAINNEQNDETAQQPQRRQQPMPRSNGARVEQRSPSKPYHQQSSRDLVREAMRESGIDI